MRVPVLALALLLAATPLAAAGHRDGGGYRCDGGWCRDGEVRTLDCSGDGCTGETGGFTTIVHPPLGDGAWLGDDDPVLGVRIDGEAVAYPIRIISGQQGWEMVIDTVGGVEIQATYCPLCASGIVYRTQVDGDDLTFRNSGAIWKRDMVMFDVETGSLWSQVAGEAIHGPMEGAELALVDAPMVSWGTWRDRHPDTQAMEIPRGPDGEELCRCSPVDLDAGDLVTGIVRDGDALAFPHRILRDEGVAQLTWDGTSLVATYRGATVHLFDAGDRSLHVADDHAWLVDGDGRRYDAVTGEAEDGGEGLERLSTRTTFEHRWTLFFEDSDFYQGGSEVGPPPPQATPSIGAVGVVLAGLGAAWAIRGRRGTRRP